MPLTETQQKFIELEKKKAVIKQFFDELRQATQAVVDDVGVGHYFQDEDGTVYKTSIPEGKFVYFEKYDVLRTRREGEKSGTLSLKEAKEHGFEVE